MRTEIADFSSPGMKAPARAGLDRAGESSPGRTKEPFTLPSETADRKATRAAPASRADEPPARGRGAPARDGVDPATIDAARALDRAAPQSALRRGESAAQSEAMLPDGAQAGEGGPGALGFSPEIVLDASPAGSAGPPLDAEQQARIEPPAANAPGDLQPSAPVPATSLTASGESAEDIPDGGAPDDALPPDLALDADAAQAAGREAIALLDPPAALDAPEGDDDTIVAGDGEGSPADRPDARAAAAVSNGAAIAELARDRSIDGRSVAEAARAMRGGGGAQTVGAGTGTQAIDEAGSEQAGESGPGVDDAQPARIDATSHAAIDAQEIAARLTPDRAADRIMGLFGAGAGAMEASDNGVENAARGLQQAGAAQSAALQAEAARAAAEAGRPTVVVPQTALAAVPMAIGLKALNGVNNFQIRLDPAELGRVDVSLEIDGEGNVNAKLVVDRVETLQLLQRDARTLERAFEQAGLKPSDGGIDLSLRDPGGGERQNGRESFEERRSDAYGRLDESRDESGAPDPGVPPTSIAQTALRRAMGGVDLRI